MGIFGLDIGGSGSKGAPVDLETGELAEERILATIEIQDPTSIKPDELDPHGIGRGESVSSSRRETRSWPGGPGILSSTSCTSRGRWPATSRSAGLGPSASTTYRSAVLCGWRRDASGAPWGRDLGRPVQGGTWRARADLLAA